MNDANMTKKVIIDSNARGVNKIEDICFFEYFQPSFPEKKSLPLICFSVIRLTAVLDNNIIPSHNIIPSQ